MKVVIRYDVGDGSVTRTIGPRALVGWELATKQRFSDLQNGMGIGDMVTMLYEQMRADGDAPATRADLLTVLVAIDPENPGDPQQLDEAASPERSSSYL